MSLILDGTNGVTFPNSTVQASAGAILQVAQGIKNTQTSTTSTSYVTTGLTVSITPKFATSKILVTVTGQMGNSGSNNNLGINLVRNSTSIAVGDARGSTTQCMAGALNGSQSASSTFTICYLDSPATTASTTYTVQMSNELNAGTFYFNPSGTATVATITLMEIAA